MVLSPGLQGSIRGSDGVPHSPYRWPIPWASLQCTENGQEGALCFLSQQSAAEHTAAHCGQEGCRDARHFLFRGPRGMIYGPGLSSEWVMGGREARWDSCMAQLRRQPCTFLFTCARSACPSAWVCPFSGVHTCGWARTLALCTFCVFQHLAFEIFRMKDFDWIANFHYQEKLPHFHWSKKAKKKSS